ncbi:hypothetical protein [Streptomyces sp. NPDC006739]|uniref:hypothetical protein n=1 Tax=Streptomyces sp. NPDC006739 TaxID=3364763 RepID=UPI0036CA1172
MARAPTRPEPGRPPGSKNRNPAITRASSGGEPRTVGELTRALADSYDGPRAPTSPDSTD